MAAESRLLTFDDLIKVKSGTPVRYNGNEGFVISKTKVLSSDGTVYCDGYGCHKIPIKVYHTIRNKNGEDIAEITYTRVSWGQGYEMEITNIEGFDASGVAGFLDSISIKEGV